MRTVRHIGSLAFVLGIFVTIFAGVPWHVFAADDPAVPWFLRIAILLSLGGFLIVMVTLVLEQGKYKTAKDEFEVEQPQQDILLLNSAEVPGRNVTEILGMAQGHTVFAVWLGKDLSAIVRLILGGELTEYTEMMGKARTVATNRMIKVAVEMGADAIIYVRYMTTSVVGSAAELLVYGTAVKLG